MSLKKSDSKFEKRLSRLYGEQKAHKTSEKIEKMLLRKKETASPYIFTEKDSILIVYADQLSDGKTPTLKLLKQCLDKYGHGLTNTVHLLPFYPSSSDDGFSVIDYKKIDHLCGSWKDIKSLQGKFRLMFDSVINHISVNSRWFKNFLEGKKTSGDFFIEKSDGFDSSKVFRPRALPLFSKFNTRSGDKEIWTTFSADQADLNYASAELLVEIIKVLLFYADKGASLLRLDAIAFIWKKSGTSCVHLRETHSLIKLFKEILREYAPDMKLVSETNVPYKENISYFGNGRDEADMIYNFSLPPLLAHALITQNTAKLQKWAETLIKPPEKSTYFNFTASHDGIGLVPAKDFLNEKDIELLCKNSISKGGFVSMKSVPGHDATPYELNINYFDLLRDADDSEKEALDKFIISQCVMLTMPGIPGIYFHSFFGSHNYQEGVRLSGINRRINREKFNFDSFMNELGNDNSERKKVYTRFKHLLQIRKRLPQLNPYADFSFPFVSDKIFAILRNSPKDGKKLLALFNFSKKMVKESAFSLRGQHIDLISGKKYEGRLNAWQSVWLEI